MEWRIVPNTEAKLLISEFGQPYRKEFVNRRGVKIPAAYPSVCIANTGYCVFRAFNQLFQVHRCVASAFLESVDEDRTYVNHLDGIKTNNHYSNLEWCTAWENVSHGLKNGLIPWYSERDYTKGNEHHSSRIPESDINWIIENFKLPKEQRVRQIDVARMYGVSATAINNIRKGRCWNWKTKNSKGDYD